MNRRHAIGLIAATLATPALGPALGQDASVLREVSKYLNQLRSIRGRFTQVNADGSRSGGAYYLVRPGRIRFEYDGGQALVIADGVNIAVFDAKSNPPVQRYPLGTTPLKLLLRGDIDLASGGYARQTSSSGGFTNVVLVDPEKPREGSMTLRFSNRPPALTQWTTRDSGGQETTVVLDTIEQAGQQSANLFNIEAQARRFP